MFNHSIFSVIDNCYYLPCILMKQIKVKYIDSWENQKYWAYEIYIMYDEYLYRDLQVVPPVSNI